MNNYSENTLIEQPSIKLFRELGWEYLDCYGETFGENGTLGRDNPGQVVLVKKLEAAIRKINPGISHEAVSLAIEEVTKDRSLLSQGRANKEIYQLLKDGVKVKIVSKADNNELTETIKIIDWENPGNNDFFLGSQFWVSGEIYKRRADLVGFVNGIPLIFIELKASHKRLVDAYDNNLRDYKNTIPQLFRYNAFIILSNGSDSKVGSITAGWEHFSEWRRINHEGEKGVISLETVIRGLGEKERLLDYIENFILYGTYKGQTVKYIAKNHQFLGVDKAYEAVKNRQENHGRLGVFWHTQGSGKSFSMIFFSQKILRKLPGNFTFVIVTDRDDLDNQIYKNFADVDAVTEPEKQIRAQKGEHLKQLLSEDHRYVFTLIQKFRTDIGKAYPKLSDRSDVIVITDEAHRSQYDVWALNMHIALPNASFIAFTGTPLISGREERTKDVFGDYISMYNFKQSVDEGATVPLYYENRIPELQIVNEHFNKDIEDALDEIDFSEAQEKKLEREFNREYLLITRNDRLDKIAEDIVKHFMGRGYMGKAMVVSLDKATAVKMYDNVQKYWHTYLRKLTRDLADAPYAESKKILEEMTFMRNTDMAVIVSSSQNEGEDLRKKGVDILSHRKRMVEEDLETKFKEANDPLRIVFVCAMWMTGFDVPTCSTIYLDKPMKDHTLMQTIARANRVTQDKANGLIVDYIGIFRNLQKALAIYGAPGPGGLEDMPIKDKKILVEELEKRMKELDTFGKSHSIIIEDLLAATDFAYLNLRDDAVEKLLVSQEIKRTYISLFLTADTYFKAILPDIHAAALAPKRQVYKNMYERLLTLSPLITIDRAVDAIEEVLDKSVASKGYIIRDKANDKKQMFNLAEVNFDTLRKKFEKSRKRIEIEALKNTLARELHRMIGENNTRVDYLERFQKLIDEYNAGSHNVEEMFQLLLDFTKDLQEEDKRAMKESLTEEELAIFDILTKPDIHLQEKQKVQVKKVAKELLEKLKNEKLVIDWRKKQQARADVKLSIEEILDELPELYTKNMYQKKCEQVYLHIYDAYYGQNRNVYAQ